MKTEGDCFYIWLPIFFKDLYIYLRDREQEQAWAGLVLHGAEAEAEGEADSLLSREPKCKAPSQDPRIMTWAEGRRFTNWATQVSLHYFFCFFFSLLLILYFLRKDLQEPGAIKSVCDVQAVWAWGVPFVWEMLYILW